MVEGDTAYTKVSVRFPNVRSLLEALAYFKHGVRFRMDHPLKDIELSLANSSHCQTVNCESCQTPMPWLDLEMQGTNHGQRSLWSPKMLLKTVFSLGPI